MNSKGDNTHIREAGCQDRGDDQGRTHLPRVPGSGTRLSGKARRQGCRLDGKRQRRTISGVGARNAAARGPRNFRSGTVEKSSTSATSRSVSKRSPIGGASSSCGFLRSDKTWAQNGRKTPPVWAQNGAWLVSKGSRINVNFAVFWSGRWNRTHVRSLGTIGDGDVCVRLC